MSRRRAPRPATEGIRAALARAAPRTPLAAVQGCWKEAVGEQVAAVAEPVSEREGAVVVACADAVWAEELDLMHDRLLERLCERVGEQAPKRLRFQAKGG